MTMHGASATRDLAWRNTEKQAIDLVRLGGVLGFGGSRSELAVACLALPVAGAGGAENKCKATEFIPTSCGLPPPQKEFLLSKLQRTLLPRWCLRAAPLAPPQPLESPGPTRRRRRRWRCAGASAPP